MYYISDTRAAVRNAQRLLGINQSGIYDEATRLAVLDFQENEGLITSGRIDYQTFVTLVKARDKDNEVKRYSQPRGLLDFPYKRGDFGEEIEELNQTMYGLLSEYGVNDQAPRGRIYAESTEGAVAILRGIFGLEGGAIVDEELHARLERERLTVIGK